MDLRRFLLGTAVAWSVVITPLSVGAQAPPAPSAPSPIARLADGHPDFSGYWSAGGPEGLILGGPPPPPGTTDFAVAPPLRNGDISNLTNDGVIARRSGDNLPLYKPEYWDKVVDLDWNGNLKDPFNSCMPAQPPRMGAPRRIVMLPTEVIFFYSIGFQLNTSRTIPFGPRVHTPDRDGTWLGDAIARWDGDDLIIETEGFNAESWIGPQGYFHGYEMKVTERFRRTPQGIEWQATVEDPEFLQKPWVMDPVRLRQITTPNYRMEEAPPCSDRDNHHLVGKQREM